MIKKNYFIQENIISVWVFIYILLFLTGIKTLFHGFPDIERFFAEWMDERLSLNYIMKFGTLNFAPTQVWHPPLYYYLTFVPIGLFFCIGKLAGLFHDKVDFIRFYFNDTQYFFFIGRMMSYIFYWISAIIIFKTLRLFFNRVISHLTTISFLFIPRLIFDFSATRPETLLFLNVSIFFYFFLKYFKNSVNLKYLVSASFFLGLSTATKYNAIFLGVIFIPLAFFVSLSQKNSTKRRDFFITYTLNILFFTFFGFFIGDPYFILDFKKYFHNFIVYSQVEVNYYYAGQQLIFIIDHLKELISFFYINFFGFLISILGCWALFKQERKLFICSFFTILFFEVYFSIIQNSCSPLRYLNPLLPIAVLLFGAGLDFLCKKNKKMSLIFIIFILISVYNYFETWYALSFGPTYLQKARAFIEKTIPEFTNICIASDVKMPQLNMTEESYYNLIKTAPAAKNIAGHELSYKDMEVSASYDIFLRRLRLESLMKKPQYNLIRWDKNIKTVADALIFLKKTNTKYLLSYGPCFLDNPDINKIRIVTLLKEFRPQNIRVYGKNSLFIYKVNN